MVLKLSGSNRYFAVELSQHCYVFLLYLTFCLILIFSFNFLIAKCRPSLVLQKLFFHPVIFFRLILTVEQGYDYQNIMNGEKMNFFYV